jgi:hypothetical protein
MPDSAGDTDLNNVGLSLQECMNTHDKITATHADIFTVFFKNQ